MAAPVPNTIVDGRYRVLSRLGAGGMADVFLAEDQQLGRKVALKLLHRRFAEDPDFVERFRREAQAAAGLQHPYVVSVYDRGSFDDTYYIAMEYLPGRSLKQLIREEAPLDPLRAIDIAIQILKAARFAHRRGVIHRDLKPHNVIVDDAGHAGAADGQLLGQHGRRLRATAEDSQDAVLGQGQIYRGEGELDLPGEPRHHPPWSRRCFVVHIIRVPNHFGEPSKTLSPAIGSGSESQFHGPEISAQARPAEPRDLRESRLNRTGGARVRRYFAPCRWRRRGAQAAFSPPALLMYQARFASDFAAPLSAIPKHAIVPLG